MIFISVIFCSSPQGKKAEGYDLPWDLVLLLVLVLGDLRQGGLDEVANHVTDRDGELLDLELVAKGKLGSLLLHLGKLVLVLGQKHLRGHDFYLSYLLLITPGPESRRL